MYVCVCLCVCMFLGYFVSLRRVLEVRVPPPDNADSAHSALASSLLTYLTLPLVGPMGDR